MISVILFVMSGHVHNLQLCLDLSEVNCVLLIDVSWPRAEI